MNEFSVCEFYPNGSYTYIRRFVSPEEAVEVFKQTCTSDMAKAGEVSRVIITDGGDMTNMDWEFGKGIVFPVEHKGKLK